MNKKLIIGAALALPIMLGAGSCDTGTNNDEAQTDKQLQQYQKSQPVPFYDYSQVRETILEIIDAKAHGVATTSFFFNQGVVDPILVCSSLGVPIASTTQATNPLQKVYEVALNQMEPTGEYTGDSSGTYVVCAVNDDKRLAYWEGNVANVMGTAYWNTQTKSIVIK